MINQHPLKKTQMQRRKRNEAEKRVIKMMIDAGVNQKMVAEHLGITPQAVNNRLKRGSVEPLVEAIDELKDKLS